MSDKIIENNQVTIEGEIVSSPIFSHTVFEKSFYEMYVKTNRKSENVDVIPVLVSGKLIDARKNYEGKFIRVNGQYRSHNKYTEEKRRLILMVFAREIEFLEEEPDGYGTNNIYLDGYVCKEPTYRKTPLGREITDVLLAVNRPYGKSDYIPCIFWGRNAEYASKFDVDEHIEISGRVQSRKYLKKISEEEAEERTAYEVSVSRVQIVN